MGDVFAGVYRIDGEVARGGMGVVYRAVDLDLDRAVALKVMATSLSRDETYRLRFRREAAMAARIDHPNVVPVFHRGEFEGVMYVVMRLIEGLDLAEVLTREGRLDVTRTTRLISQVGGALDAAHELGLVHRDVKPANILLQVQDRALLTDFGLAKQVDGDALTSAGTLLGTAAYLAPEQAKGQALDGSCDVYALACVAYHCLSGQTPYPDGPALTVAAQHVYDPVPDLGAVAADVPRAVADVVTRGLAKEPADRWPSAGAFAAALEAASLPSARPAPTTAAGPTVRAPGRRRRTWLWVAAGAALVAGAGAFALSGQGTHVPAPRPTPTGNRYAALAARLPASVYTSCRPAPLRETKGVVTAVDCASTQPGVAVLLVSQWPDSASMAANFAKYYVPQRPDGKCSTSTGVRSTWEYGVIACYPNAAHAAVLLYEYDRVGLQVLAVRADGNRALLYSWWHDHATVPIG